MGACVLMGLTVLQALRGDKGMDKLLLHGGADGGVDRVWGVLGGLGCRVLGALR